MRNAAETRRRIIEAADQLFYGEGIRAASVDAIAERAGVTKRTLYYHFQSKDELIGAYLLARDTSTLSRLRKTATADDLGSGIRALFNLVATASGNPKWKGCAFVRAIHELAGLPGHPAFQFARQHKKALESWFAARINAAGIDRPDERAKQLMIVLDGAITQVLIHRDPIYPEVAANAAINPSRSRYFGPSVGGSDAGVAGPPPMVGARHQRTGRTTERSKKAIDDSRSACHR